jgi:hypothetical protein
VPQVALLLLMLRLHRAAPLGWLDLLLLLLLLLLLAHLLL